MSESGFQPESFNDSFRMVATTDIDEKNIVLLERMVMDLDRMCGTIAEPKDDRQIPDQIDIYSNVEQFYRTFGN